MKATEQYFPVVLFIMLYKVVLSVDSANKVTIKMHANDQYFLAVLAFQFVDKIITGDFSNETC